MTDPTPTNGPDRERPSPPTPFVRRIRIKNYKSIEFCDVELGPLTVLVGRNNSGKSNFLDALRFVADALRISLAKAIGDRLMLPYILHRGIHDRRRLVLDLELSLDARSQARYGLEIVEHNEHGFAVKREWCEVRGDHRSERYEIEDGNLVAFQAAGWTHGDPGFKNKAPDLSVSVDRLFLFNAAGHPGPFRALYDSLLAMSFHDFEPKSMRVLQRPDVGGLLRPDGSNIASVLGRIERERPGARERLLGYLASVVPEISNIRRCGFGPFETLEFEQRAGGSGASWRFFGDCMSDGALRVLGTLVAVAQLAGGDLPVRLVGIEEPETALHPAASAALMDALKEAAVHTQVVVTTHSPDLLDRLDLEGDRLLVVQMRDGGTEIGPVDRASRESVVEHLATPGELLRMDFLEPDREDVERQRKVLSQGVAERPE